MKNNRSKGFFKLLIIIIVGIALLAYFKVDVRGFIDSPTTQAVIALVKKESIYVWEHFLKTPSLYVYNNVILTYVWPTLERLFDSLKEKILKSE